MPALVAGVNLAVGLGQDRAAQQEGRIGLDRLG
jgi:hypothetical protein